MESSQPAGIGPVLGAAGPCPSVKYREKVWTIGHPTQKAKAVLEGLVVQVATENLEKVMAYLSPEKAKEKTEELNRQIFAGQFRSWGTLWATICGGPDGQALFLLSLLREHHPEATLQNARDLWRDKLQEVSIAFAQVIPSFFTLMAEDLPVPPEQREAVIGPQIQEFLTTLTQLPFTVAATTP